MIFSSFDSLISSKCPIIVLLESPSTFHPSRWQHILQVHTGLHFPFDNLDSASTMMHPPPNFTVGMIFLDLYVEPNNASKKLDFLSILFRQMFCSKFQKAATCLSFSNGVFGADWKWRPWLECIIFSATTLPTASSTFLSSVVQVALISWTTLTNVPSALSEILRGALLCDWLRIDWCCFHLQITS